MKKALLIFAISITGILHAQNSQDFEKQLNSEDSVALITIANYPENLREAILTICKNPSFLVQIEQLQKSSSKEFRDVVEIYSQEEQKNFWNLTRYPKLINEIGSSNLKTKDELANIANKYPVELQSTIIKYGQKHYDVLYKINTLQNIADKNYETIIDSYSEKDKSSYRELIKHPDIINVLASNMHLSVMLGNMHSTDPTYTMLLLDSIKIKQNQQIEKETKEWQIGLEKNPEAKKEMEQAAKEYLNNSNNSTTNPDDVYDQSDLDDEKQLITNNVTNTTILQIQPYSYWFGYPTWYDYPYWYPYPYWYQFGFYWSATGIVYTGLPTPYFMHWYFFNGNHHYYYSNFSNYCLEHHNNYYSPRYQRTGFNSEIHRWEKANEPTLPRGYLKTDNERVNRLKELGRFEMNYQNSTKGIFGRNITRTEFLKNNPAHYPKLNRVIVEPRFNKQINYPKQQNPIKYNMERPNRNPSTNPQNKIQQVPRQKQNEINNSRPRKR